MAGAGDKPSRRVFVDTNVVVYAYDRTAGGKHTRARQILADLWRTGRGLISTQIVQELYVTLTRKIPHVLAPAEAGEIVEDMMTWDLVVNDDETIRQAIALDSCEKLSFWDALVVAAASRGGAEVLLSEDLPHGRTLDGVRIENPFSRDTP